MAKQVFMIGYAGRKVSDVLKIAVLKGADVFDIRFKPRSKDPQWGKANLERSLHGRYHHVVELGNKNYQGEGVELVNYEAGEEKIRQNEKPVILMCICRTPHNCHRKEIAERLRASGFEVAETW